MIENRVLDNPHPLSPIHPNKSKWPWKKESPLGVEFEHKSPPNAGMVDKSFAKPDRFVLRTNA